MGTHLDRPTYDAIAALLQHRGRKLAEIAAIVGVSQRCVQRVWDGQLARPKPRAEIEKSITLVVAASKYDSIKAARAADWRLTTKQIAKRLGLSYGMVRDVLAGRADGCGGRKRVRGT